MAKNENVNESTTPIEKTNVASPAAETTEAPKKRKYTKKTTGEKEAAAEKKTAAAKKTAEKPDAVKDAAVKKTVAKKASAAKKTSAAKKASVAKKVSKGTAETEKDISAEIVVQYAGNETPISDIIEQIKQKFVDEGHRAASIKSIKIYIKPEENAAYYVINDKYDSKLNLF